jgi:2-keto-3-deoxy-L-rhamnonate aldolase RhmA
MTASARSVDFKTRLLRRDFLLGVFVKTPHHAVIEVLATTDLDCVCLDAEHAPFDRGDLDRCLLAARAGGLPALVRTPSGAPHEILNALDLGACGIVVPHIRSVAEAQAAARAAHYGPGGRGYAGATRATKFAAPAMAGRLRAAREETTLIVQIEDAEALEHVGAIAAVEGVDALFIGRIDLTVALGETDPMSPHVLRAVTQATQDALAGGGVVGMFTPDLKEIPQWRAMGANLFLLGSDQGFLRSGAQSLRQACGG